jgi:ATP-binding cassette subfamily B protein
MKTYTKLTFSKYWEHVKKYKFSGFGMFIFLIFTPAINVIVPLYFKDFFDILVSNEPKEILVKSLVVTLFIILFLELLQWLGWRINTVLAAFFQTRVMKSLAEESFSYLHKHSFSYFNNNFVGSLVKRVNRFSRAFETIADSISWHLIPLFVNISIIIAVLLFKNIYLGLGILIWLIIFLSINYTFTKYKLKYDISKSKADTAITRVLADTITNHSNVKLFNGYGREVRLFSKTTEHWRKLQQFVWNLENFFEAIQAILMIGLEIAAFYWGIKLWEKGLFTVGDFVLLQSYVLIVMMKIWDFGRVVRRIYQSLADAEEMAEIFDTPHEITDIKTAKPLKVTRGKIEFYEVNFAYNSTREIIEKFNLTIKANEKIALAGPSGAGKSTVVKLLLRQHEVSRGKILIDGQRVRSVTQTSLWENISLVPQDPILFHRTLMENIRYGKPDATDEEVIKASKQAHCHEFIKQFPEKYDTYVGERGVKLSGGERQRVAIARAILRNAPILVLDEATSSLDSESEHLIQDALDKLMKKKTVIVIAHRLSTIMKMDRIIVIDEGGIVEHGTHAQLLKKRGGVYKKLWKYQAGGFIS